METAKDGASGGVDLAPASSQPPASKPLPNKSPDTRPSWWSRIGLAARGLGALSVLAVGAVHLQQYLWLYSAIPTIGKLFVLTFAGATVIGLALLAPIERWAGRWGRPLLVLVTLGGIALAATTFALLLVSENMPLFGFQEPGYDPAAIAASQAAEIAAVIFLGASLAPPLSTPSHFRRQRPPLETTTGESRTARLAHPSKEPL